MVLSATATSILALSATAQAAGDGCRAGFVWREAMPRDHVCVVPSSRDQALIDNTFAATRVDETNHDYGPDTCISGFVWREAFAGDHVCVTPEIRAQSARENALAASRVYVEPIPRAGSAEPVGAREPIVGGPYRVRPIEVVPVLVEADPVVVEPTYVFGGQQYDWVDNGWNGPGFYVAGLAFQLGRGFGGRSGFNGWQQPIKIGSPRNGSATPIQTGTPTQGGKGGSQGGAGAAGGKGGSQGGGTGPIVIHPTGPTPVAYHPTSGFGPRPTFSRYGGTIRGSFGSPRSPTYSPTVFHPVRTAPLGGAYQGSGFRAAPQLRVSAPHVSAPHVSAPRITVARISTPRISAPQFTAPKGGGRRR